MRALITGLGGFAGRHLAALLLERGVAVHGTVHGAAGLAGLRELAQRFPAFGDACVHRVDVGDAHAVADLVAAVQPDGVFHLAGLSFVPDSHADPTAVFRTNALGTIHVLAAVRAQRPECRVLVVGSAEAYGLIGADDLPVREDCPLRPLTPYGASKAAADLIAAQWARGYGLPIVSVRPFNHIGPGQRPPFVCADFARQLAAIERGQQEARIEVGNLDVVRDFSDVRDVVAAYAALWEHGVAGEAYNVCAGVGHSVREMLDTLIELSGLRVEVQVVAARVRAAEVPRIVGSADKLRAATGWTPRHAWRDTLADVLADWRARA